MKPIVSIWAVPVLALLGLGDATYLAITHLAGELPACGGYSGCATVQSSPYAEIFGAPIAVFGSLLFLALLAVGLYRTRVEGPFWGYATLALYGMTLAGALFMAYLTGIEALVLHAYCYWCLGLAAITLILLALTTRDIWNYDTQQLLQPRRA